ncbi:MAG: NAD(P)/FAD-dependent oxidoreductase [Candidatus Omnitrophica bacterium]|nr:NAD(P)/FAD-dependent oxidoreductase [Candidatus Omnitrophota bacterium]MBU1933139.1 NAD(P)/FAD-dependent oxidoreductase [Candidatus Omnitrophota bacterium]
MKRKRIVVIGGGPAGMMAAIRASQLGQDVTLIEKNPSLGRKLLLSGKGRCNLTNTSDLDSFLERFSKYSQFLRDAFKKFFNRELMDFFEKRGLRLKVERQMRVFPVSDLSGSILEVLKKELRDNKVRVIYKKELSGVKIDEDKVKGALFKGGEFLACDSLILATGGVSYGFTGSTGEGLDIARKSGHRIVEVRPGLVPLETKESYPAFLEGLALKNIRLRFTDGKKHIVSEIGEMMFTKTGISGPLVLSLSRRITDWLDKDREVSVELDLKPALSDEKMDARLLREFGRNPTKTIKNTLKELLPQRMVGVFLMLAKIPENKNVSQITQKERKFLVALFKAMRMAIKGPRPIKEAMVTRGGVSLKDIDPRTMESRIVKDLYFAGEMIDVDADTGGFNLQAAFSTGYLAGESASLP